jgi:hypothetical protein
VRSLRALMLVATITACGRVNAPSAPVRAAGTATPAGDARASGSPHAGPPRAHWVPRLASPLVIDGMYTRTWARDMHGPVNNNYGTAATVALPGGAVGMLHHGGRLVIAEGPPRIVGDAGPALDSVTAVPPGLGGGFVFRSEKGLWFADRFDGPLRQLTTTAATSLMFGPRVVLARGEQSSELVGTPDGAPTPTAPQDLERLMGHRDGFAVAAAGPARGGWFTRDGRTFSSLPLTQVHEILEDGDALLVFGHEGTFRVGKDGVAHAANLTDDEAQEKRLGGFLTPRVGPGAPSEASLLDAAWIPSGRRDDEWFILSEGQLWVTRTRDRELTKVGPASADHGCQAATVEGRPVVACFELGRRMQLFDLDLATGTRTLERDITVTRGMATHMGTVGTVWPPAQFVMASCEGDAKGGICFRGKDGTWRTYAKVPKVGTMLPFAGELFYLTEDAAGGMVLERVNDERSRTFDASEVARMYAAIGVDPKASPLESPVVSAGALRTKTGVRMFDTPNPFRAATAPAAPASYAVDLPFEAKGALAARAVPGIIVPAGPHALRLDRGKVYESNDGWDTWYEVAPPPTGVPDNLDGAMCDDRGCRVGAWARIGWERDVAPALR